MDTTWWPTVVSVFLVGLVGYYMRSNKGDIMERVKLMGGEVTELEDRLKADEEAYLTQKEHELICDNSNLKIRAHITDEINTLRNDIFKEIRALVEAIKKNGGGH